MKRWALTAWERRMKRAKSTEESNIITHSKCCESNTFPPKSTRGDSSVLSIKVLIKVSCEVVDILDLLNQAMLATV